MCKFTIHTRYPSLNEYTSANRSNKYVGSAMKKKCQQEAFKAILEHKVQKVDKYPIILKITWYEYDRKRDVDNITYAVKFILDAMVQTKIIVDDSQKYVSGLIHDVKVDSENPRIEVEIIN